jgi:hypothetical protein
MTVRDTSAISHAMNQHESLTDDVVAWVGLYGPCSRMEIAKGLGEYPGTISGLTTPLVAKNRLDEVSKGPCPITGRIVLFYDAPQQQMRMRFSPTNSGEALE